RPAYVGDWHGTCRRSEPAEDCSLSCGILSESGGDDVSHDALVDLRGVKVGALYRFAHNDGAQLRCAEVGETTLKFSHGSAAGRDDHGIIKRGHKMGSSRRFCYFIIDELEVPSGSREPPGWRAISPASEFAAAVEAAAGVVRIRATS